MTKDRNQDPIWQSAWTWVRRKHARGGLDDVARAELAQWVASDPLHAKTLDEASRLWFLVGMLPAANDIPIPDADDLTP